MNYEMWFRLCFAKLCREYDLKIEVISEDDIALIGRNYALMFAGYREEWEIYYITRNQEGKLEAWDMDWHIKPRAKKKDREGLLPGGTIEVTRKNGLLIASRLLEREFGELLSGGTSWMPKYLRSWYANVLSCWSERKNEILGKYI